MEVQQVRARIGRGLRRIHAQLRLVTRSVRRQLDRTGLFPDLSGGRAATLRRSVQEEGALSKSYMLMCGLSAGIAALGLLQSSTAVVIGAMLISPLMGPIASMGFGFASLDGRQIRDSARVIAVGAVIGILVSVVLTWISPIRNATPEIIARTDPTLLDLAVATLSGTAGAFATVWQRGATAIGVAIATALMPPLATLGYAIAVGNAAFVGGALLLFLTNLAAIAFSFALVARLSGAARPLAKVELNPRYVAAGIAAFAILATPLGLQLYRVTREANTVALARRVIADELKIKRSSIAQLEVKWPLRGKPEIDAVVIAPDYRNDAAQVVEKRLAASLDTSFQLNLQQVIASNLLSQTRAIVDSAVERTVNGITRDVPPLSDIRAALDLPTQAIWVDRAERTVQVVPIAAPDWTLADYHALEGKARAVGQGWTVNIIPPAPTSVVVPITVTDGVRQPDALLGQVIWALGRWGLENVAVAGFSRRDASDAEQADARTNAALVADALAQQGIGSTAAVIEAKSQELRLARAQSPDGEGVEIRIVRPPTESDTAAQ